MIFTSGLAFHTSRLTALPSCRDHLYKPRPSLQRCFVCTRGQMSGKTAIPTGLYALIRDTNSNSIEAKMQKKCR